MLAKNYDYFSDVIVMLQPFLTKLGVQVILLGGKDDPPVAGTYDLRGKTSISQSIYIVRKSKVHFGSDSWLMHAAGALNVPIVGLYGSTSQENHSPYWYDKDRSFFLSSHRRGKNPTFFSSESPKTINFIKPEDVVKSLCILLGEKDIPTTSTISIGAVYNQSLLELVPNTVFDPNFQAHMPLVVRYDLAPNENVLAQVLSTGRKVNVIAKTPINPNLLAQFRGSFASFNHEVDINTPVDYVITLKKVVPGAAFFTRETDAARIADIRFKFFDIVTIQQHVDKTKADFEGAAREYLNDPTFSLDNTLQSGDTRFKSNKLVLSNGKVYSSLAHEARDIAVGADGHDRLIDDPAWWRDMNHYLVYRDA